MSGRKVGKPRKREAKAKSTLKRTKFYAKSNRHRAGGGGQLKHQREWERGASIATVAVQNMKQS